LKLTSRGSFLGVADAEETLGAGVVEELRVHAVHQRTLVALFGSVFLQINKQNNQKSAQKQEYTFSIQVSITLLKNLLFCVQILQNKMALKRMNYFQTL